jgi:GT2 family glycosyltransferase
VAWSQGCVVLWTRRLYDAGVRYDERLFMYYEEPDLALQMKRVGLRPYVDKRVRVLHFNEERSPNPKVAYYMQRNRVYLLRKHGSPAQFAAFCTGRLAWELAKDMGKLILRYQPLIASTHLRASWDGLRGRMC